MILEATIVFEKTWNAIHDKRDGERVYRYIIHEGSSRSSKTYSLIDCFYFYARNNKNKRLTVWRDTKTDCKKTVLNDTKKHISNTGRWGNGFVFNKTESIFTYSTGSTFEIHGTDDENTVHGLTQDAAWFNEPYKISEATFNQIDQRTSDFIIIDWNPKESHAWIERLKKDPRTIVIHSTFEDNPFCPIEQRNKILSYKPLSFSIAIKEGLKTERQLKDNDFEGLTEKQIDDALMCISNELKDTARDYEWCVYGLGLKAEKPNRIFRWTPISYEDFLKIPDTTLIYGVDWGQVDPWGIVEVRYYDGALYCHELNYMSENNIRGAMSTTELIALQNEDEGLVKKHFNKLKVRNDKMIICDNNRPNKIKALRVLGYEYAVSCVKGRIIDGVSLLVDIPVYFTSCSKNLSDEQENYSRKVDRYGIVLEEPEDENNHLIDPIRYIAEYLRAQQIIKKV